MRQFRFALPTAALLLVAQLSFAQTDAQTNPETDNAAWADMLDARALEDAAVAVALAEDTGTAGGDEEAADDEAEQTAGEADTQSPTRAERAEARVEAREDVGVWGDLDDAVPFNLLSFNIGLRLSLGRKPYKDIDTDWIIYPIIGRFTDADFTDQVVFCRSGNCGLRYAKNWYEIGVQGMWNGLGYERGDSSALAGMTETDGSIFIGPFVGLRSDFVQVQLGWKTDVMGNSEGSETRLLFDFPIRFRTGYLIPHVDVYQWDTDYTNYYFGVDPSMGDRFSPGCNYDPLNPALNTCQTYLIRDDSTNIDVGFRSQWKVAPRWFLHVSARVGLYDDNIANSPIVDGSPDRWHVSFGFTYDIDTSQ